ASVISVWAPGLACRCLLHAPPPSPTLFPYTTLFRSGARGLDQASRAPVAKPDDQSFIGEQRARRFLAGFDDGEVANVRRERRARGEDRHSHGTIEDSALTTSHQCSTLVLLRSREGRFQPASPD